MNPDTVVRVIATVLFVVVLAILVSRRKRAARQGSY
jgi:hypothetical protein